MILKPLKALAPLKGTPVTTTVDGKPTTGIVVTPAADRTKRALNTVGQGAIVAVIVFIASKLGLKLTAATVTEALVVLMPVVTYVWHLFKPKPKAL